MNGAAAEASVGGSLATKASSRGIRGCQATLLVLFGDAAGELVGRHVRWLLQP